MINRRLFHFFWALGVVTLFAFLVSSCLNPIDFNPNTFKLNVNVSGSIKIDDVAVMWIINRTKTVDVTHFTINRPKASNETEQQYAYPKNFSDKPVHGESLASYHVPAEQPYTITVVWQNPNDPNETGVIGPFDVQFPRAQDYKYYLYRTLEGDIVLVNEDKMMELPPNPDANYPDPHPTSVNAQTLVVMNVTPDQNIDLVEFVKPPSTYAITNEPKAKDQEMILLGSGSYDSVAYYTKDGARYETNVKNVIVTKEDSSMAIRTNYLYFYKTIGGDYQLSQVWPPIPNDASDANKPEDALNANQGILEIVNQATPHLAHDIITRININGSEYPNSTYTGNYMAPGEINRYIVDVGPVHVSFMPQDQQYYGQLSVREIKSRKVTVLPYTNNMGKPFAFPEDSGHGSGLIRIINNSVGAVTSTVIYDKADLSKSMSIGYDGFNPPRSIQYGKVGLVPVIGTDAFPLKEGLNQLVQVVLETPDGIVVVERVADLRGKIVTIEINQGNLGTSEASGGRKGSKVVVQNKTTSPTTILGAYVYNKANVAAMAVYPLDISAPPDKEASLYVLSTVGLPIVQGGRYGAKLIVYGNGLTGIIDKDFSPDDQLFSTDPDKHVRYLTLTQDDLKNKAPGLIEVFVPVTGISISPSPYELLSITESELDGTNKSLRVGGTINLNHTVTVEPADASKKSPIRWSLKSGATNSVSLNADGVLTVTGIVEAPNNTVTLSALIEKAAGTWTAFTDISRDITIRLNYRNTIRTHKVSAIVFSAKPVEVEEGHTLDLKSLATLNPPQANLNGVPITVDDVEWAIVNPGTSTGSSLSGSTFTAGTVGDLSIRATLPANKNGGGASITASTVIRVVKAAQPFVPVTGMTSNGGPLVLPFYTQTNAAGARILVGPAAQLNLTAYMVIVPANATVQSPISWQILSTSAPANTVEIQDDHWLRVKGLANHNNTVRVKATIPNAGRDGSQPFSAEFTVTLEEHNSRLVGQGELSVKPASIQVGQTIDLNTLAVLPPKAYVDVSNPLVSKGAITAADLVWEIVSNANKATLSGSKLTGTAAGTLTVRATLPAAKNGQFIGGTAVTAQSVITVTTPAPTYPDQLTLRLIKTGGSDSVVQLVLVPVRTDYYDTEIHRTGHTRVQWAHQFVYKGKDPSFKDSFMEYVKQESGVQIISIANFAVKEDWVDVAIDWPKGNITGYHIFFIEGDNRVRGYANPGTLDPAKDKNFLFFLRVDHAYNNYLLPMGTSPLNGHKQVSPAISTYRRVIPIGYDSWNNTASIMKAHGVDAQPLHDLSDF